MSTFISYSILLILLVLIGGIIITKIKSGYKQLTSQNRLLNALRTLDIIALSTPEVEALCQKIVDVIHQQLGYSIAVIALVNERTGVIKRVAISLTSEEKDLLHKIVPVKFEQQLVQPSEGRNLFNQVVNTKKPMYTENLYDIQVGVMPSDVSLQIQKVWKLKGIFLYPLISRNKVVGILEYASSIEKAKLSTFELSVQQQFTTEVSRAIENALLQQDLRDTSQSLAHANQKLKELDQLKDEFVSVASHELRTPMTAIKSYTWMALHRSDVPLSEKMKKYLTRTLMSTQRLIGLVNDMLNVSRIEAGRIEINPRGFDMVALVKEIIDEIAPRIEELGLKVFILEEKIPWVFADEDKVREVLMNLIGNSLKFTPTGGSITVSFFSDGKIVETSVKDTGNGISKDDLTRLFKKFARLDSTYVAVSTSGGTGLGLYISKSLIELMKGKIWVTSEGQGMGTAFTFSLPIATSDVVKDGEKFHIKPIGEAKELEPVAI